MVYNVLDDYLGDYLDHFSAPALSSHILYLFSI